MRIKNVSALIIGLFLLSFAPMHDYHVCISEITYSKEKASLSAAHKLFIDDLEKAMEQNGLKGLSIDLEKEKPEHLTEVIAYIKSHISFEVNDKNLEMKYVGFEWEDHHGLWFYFEATEIEDLKSIAINNDIFTDLFSQQENIHYVTNGNEKKTLLLKKDLTKGSLSF